MVALMQLVGAVFTETINILSICSLENTKEVIMNFIALGVIAEIDNYYLSALPPNQMRCRLEDPFEIKIRAKEINFFGTEISILRSFTAHTNSSESSKSHSTTTSLPLSYLF